MNTLFLFILMFFPLSEPKVANVSEMKIQLTDGNAKRWIFVKEDITLGSNCKTKVLSFTLANHLYAERPCKKGRDMLKNAAKAGKWSLQEEDNDYVITLEGKGQYTLDIYDSTVEFIPVKTLRLRKKAMSQSQATVDEIYYAEQ